MKAIEYLSRIGKLNDQINRKIRTAEHWKEMAYNISVEYKDDGGRKSPSNNAPFEKCIERADELEREITADIDRLADLKIDAEEKIGMIEDDVGQEILRLRYVKLMLWEDVMDMIDRSRSQMFKRHKKAIHQLEKILENETMVRL